MQRIREKSSIPGDSGAAANACLWHNRPHVVSAGVSTGAMSDPGSTRMGAILQHGKITTCVLVINSIRSGRASTSLRCSIVSWFPFMVSGPDYVFHDKTNMWRRRDDPR